MSTTEKGVRPLFPRPLFSNRLFFALWLEAAARDAIAQRAQRLQQEHALGGRPMAPQRYHLTLHFLGSTVSANDEAGARLAGAEVKAERFELVLDRAGTFPGRGRPCWLEPSQPPPGLAQLHTALGSRLAAHRIRTDDRFSPHLTILREAARQLRHTPVEPVICGFSEFVLVRSVLDRQPVEYQVLQSFPLA